MSPWDSKTKVTALPLRRFPVYWADRHRPGNVTIFLSTDSRCVRKYMKAGGLTRDDGEELKEHLFEMRSLHKNAGA